MKDERVSLETAKLLKEKGFDWPVDQNHTNITDQDKPGWKFEVTPIPTQSLAQRWIREIMNKHIEIIIWHSGKYSYILRWDMPEEEEDDTHYYSKTYEEALEAALIDTLKNDNNEIIIIVEQAGDNYTAYAEDIQGIYGQGETIVQVQDSIKESIRLMIKLNKTSYISRELKRPYKLIFKTQTDA